MDQEIRSIYIPDTNVLIHDPESVDYLREGGNLLVIPWIVIEELDGLKKRHDTSFDAYEAIRKISLARKIKPESLKIIDNPRSRHMKGGLSGKNPDHLIIATTRMVSEKLKKKEDYQGYDRVVLISKDQIVRLRAVEMGLNVEDYRRNRVEAPIYEKPRTINVGFQELRRIEDPSIQRYYKFEFDYDPEKHHEIQENEGVICHTNYGTEGEWIDSFAAIRKGDVFRTISPTIQAFGLKPKSVNGNGPNWSQYIALALLLDPEIKLIFMQGGAGTGKTLLAMGSALEQRHKYTIIRIARPTVHLEERDDLGFIPGDLEEKLGPWNIPIIQALSHFSGNGEEEGFDGEQDSASNKREKTSKSKRREDAGKKNNFKKEAKEIIDRMKEKQKIVFQPLGYIRGMNFVGEFVVVDDSQNLTPHQIFALITRCDDRTKIVFTGDLNQIDFKKLLDRGTSGLAYAMKLMINDPLVASVNFHDTIRSKLADLAEKRKRS